MASVSCAPLYGVHHLVILLLFLLLIHESRSSCPKSFHFHHCHDNVFDGKLPTSLYTNTSPDQDPSCRGPCEIACDCYNQTTISCNEAEPPYLVVDINPDPTELTIAVDYYSPDFEEWKEDPCKAHTDVSVSFPGFHLVSLTTLEENVTFLVCQSYIEDKYWDKKSKTCEDAIVYGPYAYDQSPPGKPPAGCMQVQNYGPYGYGQRPPGRPPAGCMQTNPEDNNNKGKQVKIILSSVFAVAAILLIAVIIYWRRRKNKSGSTTCPSRIISLDHTRSDLEEGSMTNGMTVFSYAELQEVTDNFDPARELGEGGFGVVYYGKLQDGREVAVKRMYEKNYKQVEQFKNEIQILTNMRHPNLVTLYGSSSRHSRELLLVYEYIPNGTVADHLHGDQSKSVLLLWPTRMRIAIETALALSYLHYNDIIHRDIKTNNILLDRHFCAKVADFGLSRLFPPDMTHVSTAPQGTPGYLDPEYHHCYHLTDKSDVYSFGVVLIELISSLPAIDMDRERHEVNLSNYAMIKIQCSALDELVDPNLGFEKNFKVRRMTTLVAELAFQCLQDERELRPSMEEVLETLKRIEGADYDKLKEEEMGKQTSTAHATNQNPSPTDSDDIELDD